jgi:hypothetical protein
LQSRPENRHLLIARPSLISRRPVNLESIDRLSHHRLVVNVIKLGITSHVREFWRSTVNPICEFRRLVPLVYSAPLDHSAPYYLPVKLNHPLPTIPSVILAFPTPPLSTPDQTPMSRLAENKRQRFHQLFILPLSYVSLGLPY